MTLLEQIRQWLAESGGSLDDKVSLVRSAFHEWYNEGLSWDRMAWVLDVFDDHIMVAYGRKMYRVDYVMDTEGYPDFTGAPWPWPEYVLEYVPVSSAATETPASETPTETETPAEGESEVMTESVNLTIKLAESSPDDDGLFPGSVIVVEGLSANNNEYTRSALKSGITIFEGAKLVADHELEEGEMARPEGSIHDVIGKVTNIRLGENEQGSPALLGDVYISKSETKIRTKVHEGILGDLSIKAWGSGNRAEDGHFVVEAFQPHPYTNVAMVTVGAAGGQLVTESVTVETDDPDPDEQPVTETPRREVRALRESDEALTEVISERDTLLEENTRLFERLRTIEADGQISEALVKVRSLPVATLQRINAALDTLKTSYATHGNAQTLSEFRAQIDSVIEAERAYLAQITPNGAVTGLTPLGTDGADVDSILESAFEGLVPTQVLPIAVRGRGQ